MSGEGYIDLTPSTFALHSPLFNDIHDYSFLSEEEATLAKIGKTNIIRSVNCGRSNHDPKNNQRRHLEDKAWEFDIVAAYRAVNVPQK
jgi:hypothetical protein